MPAPRLRSVLTRPTATPLGFDFMWVGWSLVLTSVVVGPMSEKGWVVLLDWVTGPSVRFADRIFTGTSLPAGPLFFGSAALLHALFGAAVGWLLPAAILMTAGIGAARLTRVVAPSRAGQLTGATAYLWNPFVQERLYAGQLAVLLGYAILPFLLSAALSADRGRMSSPKSRSSAIVIAALWALAAAASIHYIILGGIIVASVAATEWMAVRTFPLKWFAVIVSCAGILTALWLVPRLSEAPDVGNRNTVAAFATRPDPVLGLAGGVAAQRGFWRPSPGGPSTPRGGWWALAVGCLGGLALSGLITTWRDGGDEVDTSVGRRRIVVAVTLVGFIGWLLGQGADGPIGGLYRALTDLRTLRIMREAGKFIALVSLPWSVGLASASDRLWQFANKKGPATRLVFFLSCAVLPIGLAPGLANGIGGRIAAVTYPPQWQALSAALKIETESDLPSAESGRLVVLPFIAYYDPGFTNDRTVRSTAGAYFGSRALLSDDAEVAGLRASTRTSEIANALSSKDAGPTLARYNVRWVIASSRARTFNSASFLTVSTDGDWTLYRNTLRSHSP